MLVLSFTAFNPIAVVASHQSSQQREYQIAVWSTRGTRPTGPNQPPAPRAVSTPAADRTTAPPARARAANTSD
jgi:hypothetical protein